MNKEGEMPMEWNRLFLVAVATVCVSLVFCTSSVLAENRAGTINISPSLGYYAINRDPSYGDGIAWGLGVGLNFTRKMGAEFTFNSVESSGEGDDATIFLYRFDMLYHVVDKLPEKIVPYVAAGFGIITMDSESRGVEKDYDTALNTGLGLKYFLNRNLALRGDARYILDYTGSDLNHSMLYTAGLTLQLGLDDEQPVLAPVAAAPVVQAEVCPQGPAGCADKDWCTKDTDADGVQDCLDKCPDTPRGIAVEPTGCPPAADQGAIIFRNILFDFGKADVKAESYPVLDQVVEYLMANPGIRMEIQGHTDSRGTAEFNLKLSEKRADAVRAYLVGKGVPAEQLDTRGLGLTKPVAPNDTDENRARNRRVEFRPI